MKINLRLRTDSQNWELQCANCILHSFCDYVCVIFFSEPGAKTAQHVQVNYAISRDNFLWIPSVILSFRFLTSRSSLLFLITPVLDRFPSPCRTCHPVSAFFNIPLHFFSFSSSLMEGQGPGVDGRRGRLIRSSSFLYSFITFSCSFLGGGNLIRRAITFSGHLSPCHLWKKGVTGEYWQTETERKRNTGKKWDCIMYTETKRMDDIKKRKKEGKQDVVVCLYSQHLLLLYRV